MAGAALAQTPTPQPATGRIAGRVTAADTGLPIANAEMSLFALDLGHREVDGLRNQEALEGDLARAQAIHEAVVEDALVERVLIG